MATSKKSATKPQKEPLSFTERKTLGRKQRYKSKTGRREDMKTENKASPKPKGATPSSSTHFSEEVRESVASVRATIAEPLQERKPIIHLDKVYLQGIKFEIASIRQVLERVSKQIDALDRKISEL